MNQKETLELFSKGREAWNTWANEMLAKKEVLEKAAEWKLRRAIDFSSGGHGESGDNNKTKIWLDLAKSDFSTLRFGELITQELDDAKINTTYGVSENSEAMIQSTINSLSFDGFIFPGEANFEKACFSKDASFKGVHFIGPARFDFAQFLGCVSFEATQFIGDARFEKVQFTEKACFMAARFSRNARFSEAQFLREATFTLTHFSDDAWFSEAQFYRDTSFGGSQFAGPASFIATQFKGEASFAYAVFNGQRTNFENAEFCTTSSFRAITVIHGFDLGGAFFSHLPDFVQAHFAEVPSLDNIRLGRSAEGRPFWHPLDRQIAKDVVGKCQALRRLAIQGHDGKRERFFLKCELRSRRGSLDKLWHATFWFAMGYDLLSNFGASIGRPIAWGAFWTASFATAYYLLVFSNGQEPCGQSSLAAISQAVHLSIKNAVLLISWDSATDLHGAAKCLENVKAPPSDTFGLFINTLQLLQKLGSVVLWFLLLLAVRNRFKIK